MLFLSGLAVWFCIGYIWTMLHLEETWQKRSLRWYDYVLAGPIILAVKCIGK